ncbi:E3 ubiquitin-protein ligase RMA1H1-like [Punica granatum]|uniref:E3 ubiquitin-protein ligase RMA n=2 Tax=Punica granatum TaxID=22663 RepID=A0A2I0JEF8_PUNGR|nr:E3 ubiquitin-protein ligase RMA1H1-like [Punica granatum]PKI54631.1 hypothetical protein CRG98_024982 [Punica granatum]
MALEQYGEEVMAAHRSDTMSKSSGDWKSISAAAADSEDCQSAGFECNICLDTVQDPVVTLCGHLYCWPCIYKWLEVQGVSSEGKEPQPQQCPVCKAEICTSTLVPLYGRGRTSKPSKSKEQAKHLGIVIPRRPFGLTCGFESPRTPSTMSNSPSRGTQSYNQIYSPQLQPTSYHPNLLGGYGSSPTISFGGTAASVIDPLVGMIGEMVYARMSGNSTTTFQAYPNSYHLAGGASPRVRRHVMQADRSLSRICFFLLCCIFLCLLLF